MTDWSVICCASRNERVAATWLERFGAVTYVPQYGKPMRRSKSLSQRQRAIGVMRTQLRPLFPGYVFAQLAGLKRELHSLPRIYGYVHFGDLPGHLPDEIIARMRASERQGRFTVELLDRPRLSAGQACRVVAGPFAGFVALVERIIDPTLDRDWRIRVVMELFGRQTRVELEVEQVAAF